jgi:hypothetical protein
MCRIETLAYWSLDVTESNQWHTHSGPLDWDDKPFCGCMKGLATFHCDLTKPVDVEWEALK